MNSISIRISAQNDPRGATMGDEGEITVVEESPPTEAGLVDLEEIIGSIETNNTGYVREILLALGEDEDVVDEILTASEMK